MKRTEIIRRLTSTLDRKPKVTEINVSVDWLRTLMAEEPTGDASATPEEPAPSEPPKKTRTRRKPAESQS